MSLSARIAPRLAVWRVPLTFGAVGMVGFVIDAGVLTILFNGLGFGHFTARIVSFGLAVSATWLLNRTLTFSHSRMLSLPRQFGLYLLSQSAGTGINFVVYALCIATIASMEQFPALAVAAGAAVAMAFNYLTARHIVFRA